MPPLPRNCLGLHGQYAELERRTAANGTPLNRHTISRVLRGIRPATSTLLDNLGTALGMRGSEVLAYIEERRGK